jgi:hypothetical protein
MPTIADTEIARATSVAEKPIFRVKNRALVVITAPAPNRLANDPSAMIRSSGSTGIPRRVNGCAVSSAT